MIEHSDDHPLPPPAATIAHVADFSRCYPGEKVTFFTRVDVQQAIAGFTLRIAVPDGLAPGETRAIPNPDGSLPQLVFLDGARYLSWTVRRELSRGERCEFQLEATIAPTARPLALSSRAVVLVADRSEGGAPQVQAETTTVEVAPTGRLLKYLPALYAEQDEFMGRFVMLFESFWLPIEDRINHVYYYLDPKLAPPDLLPWLATWVDLVLDEKWPEEKRRKLLSAMVLLYRQRGTRRGLQQYLEIYTGQQAHIVEHRAHNFQLGKITRLGPSAALGKRNVSHTFSVTLTLPPAANEEERKERQRKIEAIIESEKPAHTAYTLALTETH
jgi:phage tail-like protein